MKKVFQTIFFMGLGIVAFTQSNKPMNDDDVIMMKKSGFGDTLIMQSIAAAKQTDFNISPTSMLDLKKQGVSDNVISVMIKKEQFKNSITMFKDMGIKPEQQASNKDLSAGLSAMHYGLYIQKQGIYTPIIQNTFSSEQSSGFLHNNVSGFINKKNWSVLTNTEASARLKSTDTIYCVLDKTGDNTNLVFGKVNSPNQLVLVKLEKRKNGRGISLSSTNAVSSTMGVSDKDRVPFKTEQLENGIYKIYFENLKDGEYCFLPAAANSMAVQVYGASVYDFGIGKD